MCIRDRGGVAAALANVDTKDNWETHFKDTMKGGKMLNNWQMALYHAQEAPERVRELEYWGALFDRTKEGRINQRAFGGHTWKRLAHVGDRTGLEMIRTLQEKGIHSGMGYGAFHVDVYSRVYSLFLESSYHLKTGSVAHVGKPLPGCLLYTSPSPRDRTRSRMPSSA